MPLSEVGSGGKGLHGKWLNSIGFLRLVGKIEGPSEDRWRMGLGSDWRSVNF